ncbi:glycoside hydrolase family 130 protein [Mesonia sp.]|uniref:glycoside hydrolase family 130 protein n=1 Tax=Mesonia sp. TaxID=1960830 RepID=UPI001754DA09|nr:glycoside hydrolase family 130 protein [Mesonia sp.]HIB38526.1 hypothetical protein [Mesonia sp.]HIO27865.1 hypothetical protein [Flavobacteriaceae bacterium]
MKFKILYTGLLFTTVLSLSSCKDKNAATETNTSAEVTTEEKSASTENKDWAIIGFKRPEGVNPVLAPTEETLFFSEMNQKEIAWESNDVFNPAATVMGDSIYVLYRAEDKSGKGIGERTSRIGLAATADGFEMNRRNSPVLYPKNDSQKEYEWPGGCEDPRVAMTEDGTYVMLYTQWNKDVPRLAVATSKNLTDWEKHGPAFEDALNGKYLNRFSKSASVVSKIENGKQVITKVNGKYLMYWGEKNVFAATSENLKDWEPVEENGKLKVLMSPRKGFFDSQLTECGPPAILTDKGIVVMYNGKNLEGEDGDKDYTANSYCAGQVLFDKEDPTKLLDRLDKPFLVPTASFEKSGQYPAGTVFIEGLVWFKNKWYLYYGCADSRVGVVVSEHKI